MLNSCRQGPGLLCVDCGSAGSRPPTKAMLSTGRRTEICCSDQETFVLPACCMPSITGCEEDVAQRLWVCLNTRLVGLRPKLCLEPVRFWETRHIAGKQGRGGSGFCS